MFLFQDNLLKLYLLIFLASVFFVQGCRKKEPVEEINNNEIREQLTNQKQYANDLDRLNQLSDRINSVCRGSFVVVLGGDNSSSSGGSISVDYGLLDRLSDDGVAVLIAEAMTASNTKSIPSAQQSQVNITKEVLQADETVGRYIARAGFNSGGFAEWLEAQSISVVNPQDNIPEQTRISAFMRGFLLETGK